MLIRQLFQIYSTKDLSELLNIAKLEFVKMPFRKSMFIRQYGIILGLKLPYGNPMKRPVSFMHFFRKKKRFWLIAGLLAFSVFFLVAKWLQSYTDRLLGQAIVELVARETKGIYAVRYTDLQFEVLKNKLQLSQLAIFPLPNRSDTANRYALRVRSVALETESLWQIYFTKELKIIGLTFIRPEITVESFPSREQKSPTFSRETGNLYLLIKNYLDKFQIKHFALYQASFAFVHHGAERTSDYRFRHINFVLQNLVIDSASVHNRKKIFYADGFDLSIDGQEITLPDSLHAFTFDKLEISTQKASITFRNFRLLPRQGLHGRYANLYRMSVPELTLQGVDFAKAYNDNSLIIKNLQIIEPDITINRTSRHKPQLWQADRTILKIIASIFDSVAIGKFHLRQGAFALSEARSPKLLLPHMDFGLDSFAFALPDTAAAARFPTLKNAELTLRNQRFFIGDSLYAVGLRYLRLTSHPARLTASGIVVRERQSGTWQERLHTDSLAAQLYNWEQIADDKPWHFTELYLLRPLVHIRPPDNRQPTKPASRLTKFTNRRVLIDRLQIRRGQLTLGGKQYTAQLQDLNLQMEGLALPPDSELWAQHLLMSRGRLSCGQTALQTAQIALQLGSAQLQTRNGFLQAEGNALHVQTGGAEGNCSRFFIKNLNIRQLWTEGWQPAFDTLRLINADLRLYDRQETPSSERKIALRGAIIVQGARLWLKGKDKDFLEIANTDAILRFTNDSVPMVRQQGGSIRGLWNGYRWEGKLSLADTETGNLELRQLSLQSIRSDSAALGLERLVVQGWDAPTLTQKKLLKINRLQLYRLNGHFRGKADASAPPAFDSLHVEQLEAVSDSLRLVMPAWQLQTKQLHVQLFALKNSPAAFSEGMIEYFSAGNSEIRLQPLALQFTSVRLTDKSAQTVTFNNLQLQHPDFDGFFREASLTLPDKHRIKGHPLAVGALALAHGTVRWHPDSVRQPFPPAKHPRIGNLLVQDTHLTGDQLAANISLLQVEQPFGGGEQSFTGLQAGNIRWRMPNGRDLLQVNTALYEPAIRRLLLDSVRLQPHMSIEEFYERYPVRRSYNNFTARHILVHQPCWDKLLAGEGLFAPCAHISGLVCNVFLDKNFPRTGENRLFPLNRLAKMPLEIRIDTVRLTEGTVQYRERTRRREIASLNLTDMGGHIYGLHNRAQPTDSIRLHVKAKPEGNGEIDLDAFFVANHEQGQHRLESTFDSIPLAVFNRLAEPLAGVSIRSGLIVSGSMSVTADRERARGKMWLYYENLRFSILSRRTKSQEELITKHSPLLSMLANTLIRNKSKRILLYKGREGHIWQVRDPEKSMFAFWGRIILNGALSSIGISQHIQEKWQQQIREREERQD